MTGVYSVRGDEPIFEVEHLAKVLILSLIADPAAANYRSKQFEYNRLMKVVSEPKTRHVLFDFDACQTLDSVSMGVVIALTLRIQELGGNAEFRKASYEDHRISGRFPNFYDDFPWSLLIMGIDIPCAGCNAKHMDLLAFV